MRKLGLLSAAAALVLVASSPGGASAGSPLSRWESIAGNTASAAAKASAEIGKPVYVQPRDQSMAFSEGFQNLLRVELTQRGVAVVPLAAGALTMRYDVVPVPGYGLGFGGGTWHTGEEHGDSEVLVTAEVLDGETVMWRGQWTYDVADADLASYVAHVPGAPITNPPPLDISNIPAREMRVVGSGTTVESEAVERIYRRMQRK